MRKEALFLKDSNDSRSWLIPLDEICYIGATKNGKVWSSTDTRFMLSTKNKVNFGITEATFHKLENLFAKTILGESDEGDE